MILKKLSLKNFLAHTDTEVEFAENGLTAFIGDNGAGKTSIIEGIYFALFGKSTKGKSQRDLVQWGKGGGVVELEFQKGKDTYVVRREIKLSGRSANSQSVVYKYENGVKKPYFQKHVNEELLKLLDFNYKTFLNSILVKQGDIEGLINLTPSKRSEVFEDLLDMSLYQILTEFYKEKIRALKNKLEGIRTNIEDENQLEEELEKLKEEKGKLEAQKQELEREKQELEEKLRHLEEQIQKTEEERRRYVEIKSKIEKGNEYIQELEDQINGVKEKLQKLQKAKEKLPILQEKADQHKEKQQLLNSILEREKLQEKLSWIERELEEFKNQKQIYQQLKELAKEFEEKQKQMQHLQESLQRLAQKEGTINAIKNQIEQERKVLKETREEALKLAKQLTQIKRIYKTLELNPVLAPTMIRDGETIISQYQQQLEELAKQISSLSAKIKLIDEQLQNVSSLEGECPTCLQPLENHRKEQIIKDLTTQKEKLQAEKAQLEEQYLKLKERIEKEKTILELLREFDEFYKKHKEADQKVQKLKSELFVLQRELEKSHELKEQLQHIQNFLKEHEEDYLKYQQAKRFLKSKKDQVQALKEQKEKIEEKLKTLPQIEQSVEQLKQEVAELEPYYRKLIQIQEALNREEELKNELEKLVKKKEKADKKLEELKASLPDIQSIQELLLRLQQERKYLQESIQQLNQKLIDLSQQLGQINAQIKSIQEKLQTINKVKSQQQQIQKQIEAYERVVFALGPEGIQKLIRENALYNLPKLVNSLFSYFGFPFNQVKFDEKFDIKILAPTAERRDRYISVDALSGGQKVALGLALRLALSRFLGEKSDFIILDEPTIHLDQYRREELVNILLKLKDRNFLKQMIVITHDRELEDAADRIYYVNKGQVELVE